MDREYQASHGAMQMQDQHSSGYRHKYVQESDSALEGAGSWISRGSGIQHPELATVDLSTTTSRDHVYLDQPFNQFGNVLISASEPGLDDCRVGEELLTLTEFVMESHTNKARDFEVFFHSLINY